MFPIKQQFITKNRPFKKLKSLKGIIIHWTANLNKGANASANARYFDSDQFFTDKNGNKKKTYASAHFMVDDHQIIQCLPDDEVGYHVGAKVYKELVYLKLGVPRGDTPNNYTLGIEMCVNADGDFNITRQQTIELTGHLLKKFGMTIHQVYRHFDITGKDCPKMMLEESIWQQFLHEVEQGMQAPTGQLKVNTPILNVRSGPGTEFGVTRQMVSGTLMNKMSIQGNWIQIGNKEWVNANYVLPVS